jgi:hypothetical protein
MSTKRPASLMVALVLLALLSLGNLVLPFVPGTNNVPAPILYSDVVVGVIGLVAAFGLRKARRWGMILTLIVSAFNILSAAPGLLVAPNPGLRVTAGLYVALSVLIIVLVVLPSARQTYGAKRVSGTVVR